MFRVTKQWILEYSTTGSGGWTRKQLEALGYPWPPPTGWLEAIEGTEIRPGMRVRFEYHCNREAAAQKKIEDAARHEEMAEMIFYTWPTADGWTSSFTKPEGWFR